MSKMPQNAKTPLRIVVLLCAHPSSSINSPTGFHTLSQTPRVLMKSGGPGGESRDGYQGD